MISLANPNKIQEVQQPSFLLLLLHFFPSSPTSLQTGSFLTRMIRPWLTSSLMLSKGHLVPSLVFSYKNVSPFFLQREQTDSFPKLYVLDAFCLTIPSLSHFSLFTFYYKNSKRESHIFNTLLRSLIN